MKYLQTGNFFGQTNKIINIDGVTLTDTEYTHPKVDWHYHENAYFTFILSGNVIEGNKKEIYNCSAGSLLFHNWQDPHYNIKPEGFTRGFHIEINNDWIKTFMENFNCPAGSINIKDPQTRLIVYKIYKEIRFADDNFKLSINQLLINLLQSLEKNNYQKENKTPHWVSKLKHLLNDCVNEKLSLQYLSEQLGIHPVHLSRDFPKYFSCNLGEYIRKVKIEKSLSLFSNPNLSLTEIAHSCGFADQSHFLRCFKEVNGIKPSSYRKLILEP